MQKTYLNLVLICILALAILSLITFSLWKTRSSEESKLQSTANELEKNISQKTTEELRPLKQAEETPLPEVVTGLKPTPLPVKKQAVNLEGTPRPTPTMNPEDQPRKFYVQDFRNLDSLPEGFKTDNLQLTKDGLQLLPPKPGEENMPRSGTLESPTEQMDFPSNAVSPLWQEKLPDGTSVFVEVSVTPDGENWGSWNPISPDMDSYGQINENYPDGRPNPNYGYTPGGVLCWGLKQYKSFRYRITLYSETPGSPTLEGFRLFYQDSTLGEGHIAEPDSQE